MKRRHIVKSLPVLSSLPLAGCMSGLRFGRPGTVLGKIEIVNSSLVSNKIRLIVTREDKTLVDQYIGLEAIDAEDGTASTIIEPFWSPTQSQYTLIAAHYDESGNRESETWEYTFTQKDYNRYYGDSHEDPGCIGAIVIIGNRTEKKNGAIGISPIYMEEPCGKSE